MNTRKILSIAAIAILLVTSTIVLAQEGHLRVKNCSTVTIYVATADWIDPLGWIPYKHNAKHLKPQQTHYFYCRKTWTVKNAPGCEVILRNSHMVNPIRILRKSGDYIVISNGYIGLKRKSICD